MLRNIARSLRKRFIDDSKLEERIKERDEKQRMKALRENDMSAYTELVKKRKDDRLQFLLDQTDSLLSSLRDFVETQKAQAELFDEIAITTSRINDDSNEREKPLVDAKLPTLKMSADLSSSKTTTTRDYYKSAHQASEKFLVQPSLIVGGTMKPYQLVGLEWMVSLYNNKLSGILADELEASGKFKIRAKGPIEQPDIRVITSYEISKGMNYEDIADLLGEQQMNRIRTYQDMVDKYDNEILDRIVQSQKLATRRSELKIVRSGEGRDLYTTPSGAKIEADGAFAGPNGILHRQDSASNNTLNWMTEGQTYLSYDAMKGIESSSYAGRLSEARTVVQPTDPQYFNEMSVFTNRILRQDQLALRILQGQGDSEIAGWLRKEGKFYF